MVERFVCFKKIIYLCTVNYEKNDFITDDALLGRYGAGTE